jgi:hypothetical protein
MSPIDQEIVTSTSTSVALITGEIPPQFVGSGEFRAYVSQDGRGCAARLWLVSPDGTGAGLPSGREMIPNVGRHHAAYCRITEDRSAVRIIIPAVDCWTAPTVIYAKVAIGAQAEKIRVCYE